MRRLLTLLPAALLLIPTVAGAAWSSAATGTASIGARTMGSATGFSAACVSDRNKSPIRLAWTRSSDPLVTQYDIVRTGSGGGVSGSFSVGGGLSEWEDAPLAGAGISYTYEIRGSSTSIAWRSPYVAGTGTVSYTQSKCTTAP